MVGWINRIEYGVNWYDNLGITFKVIHIIVWFHSIVTILMCLWIAYVFTVREWMDWRRVRMGKPDYDMNGISRMKRIRNVVRDVTNSNEV